MAEYPCPHCGNSIYDDEALLCLFCGESLERPGHGFLGRLKYAHAKHVAMIVIAVMVVAFLLLYVVGR